MWIRGIQEKQTVKNKEREVARGNDEKWGARA